MGASVSLLTRAWRSMPTIAMSGVLVTLLLAAAGAWLPPMSVHVARAAALAPCILPTCDLMPKGPRLTTDPWPMRFAGIGAAATEGDSGPLCFNQLQVGTVALPGCRRVDLHSAAFSRVAAGLAQR